jgi:surfactin synthase thioesterase subunit
LWHAKAEPGAPLPFNVLVRLPGHWQRISENAFTRLLPLVDAIADESSAKSQTHLSYTATVWGPHAFELSRELFRRYVRGPRLFADSEMI